MDRFGFFLCAIGNIVCWYDKMTTHKMTTHPFDHFFTFCWNTEIPIRTHFYSSTLLLLLLSPLTSLPSPCCYITSLPSPSLSSPFLPPFLPSVLWGQLEHCSEITTARLANFDVYANGLLPYHKSGLFRIPHVPTDVQGNAHIFFMILPSKKMRLFYETELKRRGVSAFSHYVPLHRWYDWFSPPPPPSNNVLSWFQQ